MHVLEERPRMEGEPKDEDVDAVRPVGGSSEREPDFFLVGAPRCGTTSLAAWLREHERAFVTDPKEPDFFSRDIGSPSAIRDERRYRALFRGATSRHVAVGEGSTTYLRSRVAVPAILERYPNARFLVCLRNPIDMARSVHAQHVRTGREPERSFERAWRLQAERREGRSLPPHLPEPADLQYARMCALGSQLDRLLRLVPRSRVHPVLLEDMAAAPAEAYRGVLRFLGLPDDGRADFPVHGRRGATRSLLLARAYGQLLHLASSVGVHVPMAVRRAGLALNDRGRSAGQEELSPRFREELFAAFEDEVLLLERLLNRDLRDWVQDVEVTSR